MNFPQYNEMEERVITFFPTQALQLSQNYNHEWSHYLFPQLLSERKVRPTNRYINTETVGQKKWNERKKEEIRRGRKRR